jgi:hypothetical protein
MTQDEFSDDLIRHCEQEALGAVAADTEGLVRAVLRASGYAELVAALEPFVALADKRDARYRKRGGNPDSFPDAHPSYDISAEKLELPMGAFRRARAALAAAGHKQGSGE